MWELDNKEGWALKNLCFQIMVLEKTLESPLDYKVIKPVNHKGIKSWIFTGRTNAEAEAPILWPPDAKNGFTVKDPDAEKDWRQEEKEMTGDKMVGLGWTQWTWIWAHSRRQWRQGKLGVLQFMGSQRIRHDLETEKQLQQHPFYYLRLLPKSGYKINPFLPISHPRLLLKTSL